MEGYQARDIQDIMAMLLENRAETPRDDVETMDLSAHATQLESKEEYGHPVPSEEKNPLTGMPAWLIDVDDMMRVNPSPVGLAQNIVRFVMPKDPAIAIVDIVDVMSGSLSTAFKLQFIDAMYDILLRHDMKTLVRLPMFVQHSILYVLRHRLQKMMEDSAFDRVFVCQLPLNSRVLISNMITLAISYCQKKNGYAEHSSNMANGIRNNCLFGILTCEQRKDWEQFRVLMVRVRNAIEQSLLNGAMDIEIYIKAAPNNEYIIQLIKKSDKRMQTVVVYSDSIDRRAFVKKLIRLTLHFHCLSYYTGPCFTKGIKLSCADVCIVCSAQKKLAANQ